MKTLQLILFSIFTFIVLPILICELFLELKNRLILWKNSPSKKEVEIVRNQFRKYLY